MKRTSKLPLPSDPEAARLLEAYEADRMIAFKPSLVPILGGENTAKLLHQILYWTRQCKYHAFYKFAAPCNHIQYRKGDSWQEELRFSRHDLETAREQIGVCLSKTLSRDAALANDEFVLDDNGVLAEDCRPVIYWRDQQLRAWYEVNWPVLFGLLKHLYPEDTNQEQPGEPTEVVEVRGSREKIAVPLLKIRSGRAENSHSPISEVTSKVTTDSTPPAGESCPNPFLLGESHREWWMRVCKDKGEATVPNLAELYTRLFGKSPNYGRLGKIFPADLRRNPKFIFCCMVDTLKMEIIGEPYNYLQSLVKSGGKFKPEETPSPVKPGYMGDA